MPPSHPGEYIRQNVIPLEMTVTKAAKLLGVSRPTLSNLLNGKAALSSEMALRLEKAFGAKKESLLQMQASHDDSELRKDNKEIPVHPYVGSFLEITAAQISAWANREASRSLLPVFLRRLVLTTSPDLTKVDFPGYDNAQRHGWDGQVEATSATPWVPLGTSGWEFGCDQDPKRKAEGDYTARTQAIPQTTRNDISFVFVTPRNWPGKDAWSKEKKAEGLWKDVRAYDASDLEQWLEQSLAVQSWLAEKLGTASPDILSLDQCWANWAEVTDPPLAKELFADAITNHEGKITKWLAAPPSEPLTVTAESEEEALAFLACALETVGSVQAPSYERALVVKSANALKKAASASQNFLAILVSSDAQASSAGIYKILHTIVFSPRGVTDESNIELDLTEDKTFEAGLAAMGKDHQEKTDLARESGQSLTILRRRLAKVPAIKSPPWAQDATKARRLIPLMLAGVWNAQHSADQEVMSFLTGQDYKQVEVTVAELLRSEQSPLWAIGKHRGIASKIDALYATHHLITKADLTDFLERARVVLAESDPALELPPEQRWMAGVHNKTRNHSRALRRSIRDTLILLAAHGGKLVNDRLGIDAEARVGHLVREILGSFDTSVLASQKDDLPAYAEAAPDMFLGLVEEDLKKNDPAVMTLMQPADSGLMGGGCPRTGLLWALELLAWNPDRLVRVALVLAKLSERPIDDNWANKPEASLKAALRSWMPQTAADIEQRCAVLERIAKRHPAIGWRICMSELQSLDRMGMYSYRPHWRKDAKGFGQPLKTWDEIMPFKLKALDLAIGWAGHSAETLGDLVECLHSLTDDQQQAIWSEALKWIASRPSDDDKALLKERIRRFAFTRRAKKRQIAANILEASRKAVGLLEPTDLVSRHAWLFKNHWVEESQEEFEDEKFDHNKHEERVASARHAALAEIWSRLGYEGVKRLCQSGQAAAVIGWILADKIVLADGVGDVVLSLLSEQESANWVDACLSAFIGGIDIAAREMLLRKFSQRLLDEGASGEARLIRLFKAAPFNKSTWSELVYLPKEIQDRYWREVYPSWQRQTPSELRELVENFLDMKRPRAAFHAVHFVTEQLDSDLLVRLLKEVSTSDSEPVDHYHLRDYEIEKAFKVLDARGDVAKSDLTNLEFAYLVPLERSERGIPQLAREVGENPLLFVQALALAFKRRDSGMDPPEWGTNSEDRSLRATHAYRLLHAVKALPGASGDGIVDEAKLRKWIVDVRQLCMTHGREETGDSMIGELLSNSPAGGDGIWPHEVVRLVLEDVGTANIAQGLSIGRQNARGAHWVDPEGKEERTLASQYRGWAKKLAFDAPFTAKILEDLAKNYDREADWNIERHRLERRVDR